jgi:hypothetical protein
MRSPLLHNLAGESINSNDVIPPVYEINTIAVERGTAHARFHKVMKLVSLRQLPVFPQKTPFSALIIWKRDFQDPSH